MAQKRAVDKWLLAIVGIAVVLFCLMMCSEKRERYEPVTEVPVMDKDSQPEDGDTQADTIKALQAYAKAAVDKAERLHEYTASQSSVVTEHSGEIQRLENENETLRESLNQTGIRIHQLEDDLASLKQSLKNSQNTPGKTAPDDIPVGFGFDELRQPSPSLELLPGPEIGQWHDPIDRPASTKDNESNKGYTRLLSGPNRLKTSELSTQASKEKVETVEPVYTIPKDAVLMDGIAMTALIGRIPVDGTTPDPYPVKIFVGRDNLLANDHDLPEIEGMIFSGLGIGDWNLSCVSARLYSASYIFKDGTIVNHSTSNEPLGYISDPAGIPCVSGRFVTNAPNFLLKRAGLAGLGTAGAAYAEAQQQTQSSSLTGNTTRTVVGNIDKLVAGDTVKSATDEVTQWLLERQKQSFDAIVVNPGVAVAIHIDKALSIDHREFARKVRYGGSYEDIHSTMD